jgi:hypothetical protein
MRVYTLVYIFPIDNSSNPINCWRGLYFRTLLSTFFLLDWPSLMWCRKYGQDTGSTGIDEEYRSSVSMRGVVSSASETNLHNPINGALAYNGEGSSLALAA